jgi:hypothetical protein
MKRPIPGLKFGVWTFLRSAAGYTLYGHKTNEDKIERNYCGILMQIKTKFITNGRYAPSRIPKLYIYIYIYVYDIFNCSWVGTRWQWNSKHLHTIHRIQRRNIHNIKKLNIHNNQKIN